MCRVGECASIDRRIGSDLDIISDDDAADLGHFQVAMPAHREAKSILFDPHAGVDNNSVADNGVGHAGAWSDMTVIANDGPIANHCAGCNDRSFADLGFVADDRTSLNVCAVRDFGRGVDQGVRFGLGRPGSLGVQCVRIEQMHGAGERLVWLRCRNHSDFLRGEIDVPGR